MQCAQNQAMIARFRVFGLNPASCPHLAECVAPPLPLLYHPPPTPSCHPPTLLFHVACPKLTQKSSVWGFWPKPPPPPPLWQMHTPATPASMLSTCTHH